MEAAICEFAISKGSDYIREIYEALSSRQESQFYDGVVRIQILKPNGKSIFIDQRGKIFDSENGSSAELSEKKFIYLKEIIQKIVGTDACRKSVERLSEGKFDEPSFEDLGD